MHSGERACRAQNSDSDPTSRFEARLDGRPPRREQITLMSFSPDNVEKTGVWSIEKPGFPRRGRRGRASRANSKKDLVAGPIRDSCAPQAHWLTGSLALPVDPVDEVAEAGP